MRFVACRRLWQASLFMAAIGSIALSFPAFSFELGEFVTVDAALRGIVQHGRYENAKNDDDEPLDQETEGAAIGDLKIDISPTPRDTLYTKLRFVKGNALNNVGGIKLSPYNGPLEDDVNNINDSGRNYLLEGWYRHTFSPGGDTSFAVTGGIIDSTNYIDQNRYANDEDSQFMMPPFATPDNTIGAPSYDPGVALELHSNQWSLNGVYMRASNDILEDADYFGAQVGYRYMISRGPGNFRVLGVTSSGQLKKDKGEGDATIYGLGVSIDQELGQGWGIFFRAYAQNDEAPTPYDGDLSGGISISGLHWGRPDDVLGIAFAHLIGASKQGIDYTNAAEAYLKFKISRSLDFTVDVQYEKDHIRSSSDNPQAWIFGGRFNVEF